MGRILAIDYGARRCGLAWTDASRLAITSLMTVSPEQIVAELNKLQASTQVELILVGHPRHADGNPTHATEGAERLAALLAQTYAPIPVRLWDEFGTSRKAMATLVQSGVPKGKRRDKGLLDRTAAAIMLQEYLEWHG